MDASITQISTWSQDLARGLDHPLSSAARVARIAAANQARVDRQTRLGDAREYIRRAGIKDGAELLQMVECLVSNCLQNSTTDFANFKQALVEACCDYESAVTV